MKHKNIVKIGVALALGFLGLSSLNTAGSQNKVQASVLKVEQHQPYNAAYPGDFPGGGPRGGIDYKPGGNISRYGWPYSRFR